MSKLPPPPPLPAVAKILVKPEPTFFVLDGPFLIYVKKRGEARPILVLWIANDELLTKWAEMR